MHSEDDLWYRLGYALERSRGRTAGLTGPLKRLAGSGDREAADPAAERGDGSDDRLVQTLLLGGAGALASRLLDLWPRRRRPGVAALFAAGASGAAAGLLVEVLQPLLRGELRPPKPGADWASSALSGAGRGLAYGSVVEPRLVGPDFVRGFVFGTLEYMVAPWGGLPGVLGSASPHRKLPVVSDLLEPDGTDEAAYLDFVAFGIALAVLYGALPDENSGTDEDS